MRTNHTFCLPQGQQVDPEEVAKDISSDGVPSLYDVRSTRVRFERDDTGEVIAEFQHFVGEAY